MSEYYILCVRICQDTIIQCVRICQDTIIQHVRTCQDTMYSVPGYVRILYTSVGRYTGI